MAQLSSDNSLRQDSPRISLVTMGCAKNEADSYAMRKKLLQAGYSFVEDWEKADVIIINTCSFIQAATEESLEAVFDAANLPRVSSHDVPLIVVGCMPSRYGEDLEKELFEATAFLPCKQEDDIVSLVNSVLKNKLIDHNKICVSKECTQVIFEEERDNDSFCDLQTPSMSTYAYVKISDGCSRRCSYCTIPQIRGEYRSYTFEDIRCCVSEHVSSGVREIVLIAQDTGLWGRDLKEPCSLSRLLELLAEEFPRTWFRVMYLQPEGINDELLKVISDHDNICSYLDIPLQHVSESLLRKMNRSGNAREFREIVSRIRAFLPDVTLRTTLMTGFPGETDKQFEELCEFVNEGLFDYVGVFAFSREEGTQAYDLPYQIDESEKAYRAQQLRDTADAVSSRLIRQRIGNIYNVLVEGFEDDGQLYGRAVCQAPEVDGVTYVPVGNIGDIVSVRISDTLLYEMEGE